MKISKIKSDLKTILTNINELQTRRRELLHSTAWPIDTTRIVECKNNIEQAFDRLPPATIQEAVTELRLRGQRRIQRAKKRKQKKIDRKSSSINQSYIIQPIRTLQVPKPKELPFRKMELECAKKYLSMMDSIEVLHKLKGGDESCKLKERLDPVRSFWQAIQDTDCVKTSEPVSIKKQWHLALFGDKSRPTVKCRRKDFIKMRGIWDSYLVLDEGDLTGSHIPVGWVYPKKDARPDWKQFQI